MGFRIHTDIGIGTQQDGELMEITDFNGESFSEDGKNPSLVIVGKDSTIYRIAKTQIDKNFLKEFKANKDFEFTDEDVEENKFNILAACIVDWENIKDENNLDVAHTFDKSVELLKGSPFLVGKVDAFIHNRANYLAKH